MIVKLKNLLIFLRELDNLIIKNDISELIRIIDEINNILNGKKCSNSVLNKLHKAYPKLEFNEHFVTRKCSCCGKEFIPMPNRITDCPECIKK